MFILFAVAVAMAIMPLFAADSVSVNKDNVSLQSYNNQVPTLSGFAAKFNSDQHLTVLTSASQTLTIPAGTKSVLVYSTAAVNFGYADVSGSTVTGTSNPNLAANTFYRFTGSEAELAKVSFIGREGTATVTARFQ